MEVVLYRLCALAVLIGSDGLFVCWVWLCVGCSVYLLACLELWVGYWFLCLKFRLFVCVGFIGFASLLSLLCFEWVVYYIVSFFSCLIRVYYYFDYCLGGVLA